MSDNWGVQNLQNALTAWSEKLAEIGVLLTEEPEHFRGGDIWWVIFLLAKAIVTYGLELMLTIFEILQGVVGTIKLADRVVKEMMGL